MKAAICFVLWVVLLGTLSLKDAQADVTIEADTNGYGLRTLTALSTDCSDVLVALDAFLDINSPIFTATACTHDPVQVGTILWMNPTLQWSVSTITGSTPLTCTSGFHIDIVTNTCVADTPTPALAGGNVEQMIFIAAVVFAAFNGFSTGFRP